MASRVDANQSAIVKALRDMGATVQPLHSVGNGCPDLLVGWKSKNLLVEVKDGAKPPSAQKLTPDQVKWHSEWRGQKIVVNSIDAAIELLRNA
jgi:hypothetical protein